MVPAPIDFENQPESLMPHWRLDRPAPWFAVLRSRRARGALLAVAAYVLLTPSAPAATPTAVPTAAPTATPTSAPTATPTPSVAQFPGNGPATATALVAMMANTNISVIEIAGGTYAGWYAFVNIDRTAAHPLLVRPAPGANVVWDGTGLNNSPPWRIGWDSKASYITFDPAGTGGSFTIQNYVIGLAGLVMSRYTDHVTFNGVTVHGCYGTVSPQTSHTVYLDTDGTHRSQYWTSNNWTVIGPANRYLNGFQTEHGPNADHVRADNWVVTSVHRAAYLYGNATDVHIDGWTISNSDGTIDNQYGDGTTGEISNSTATNSGPMQPGQGYWLNNGRVLDGGGNAANP